MNYLFIMNYVVGVMDNYFVIGVLKERFSGFICHETNDIRFGSEIPLISKDVFVPLVYLLEFIEKCNFKYGEVKKNDIILLSTGNLCHIIDEVTYEYPTINFTGILTSRYNFNKGECPYFNLSSALRQITT